MSITNRMAVFIVSAVVASACSSGTQPEPTATTLPPSTTEATAPSTTTVPATAATTTPSITTTTVDSKAVAEAAVLKSAEPFVRDGYVTEEQFLEAAYEFCASGALLSDAVAPWTDPFPEDPPRSEEWRFGAIMAGFDYLCPQPHGIDAEFLSTLSDQDLRRVGGDPLSLAHTVYSPIQWCRMIRDGDTADTVERRLSSFKEEADPAAWSVLLKAVPFYCPELTDLVEGDQ